MRIDKISLTNMIGLRVVHPCNVKIKKSENFKLLNTNICVKLP